MRLFKHWGQKLKGLTIDLPLFQVWEIFDFVNSHPAPGNTGRDWVDTGVWGHGPFCSEVLFSGILFCAGGWLVHWGGLRRAPPGLCWIPRRVCSPASGSTTRAVFSLCLRHICPLHLHLLSPHLPGHTSLLGTREEVKLLFDYLMQKEGDRSKAAGFKICQGNRRSSFSRWIGSKVPRLHGKSKEKDWLNILSALFWGGEKSHEGTLLVSRRSKNQGLRQEGRVG